MIAVCEPQPAINSKADCHAAFLKMLPAIRRAAQISFRKAGPELREDLVSEVVARAYVGFAALAERGQLERTLPTPLACYAIAQVRAGRRVGSRLRIRDVMSQYAQFQKCFVVERLDRFDDEENCWEQLVVEDRRATPADVAICRIDFAAWLRSLGARIRKIALALARGETTTAVAKMFNVTAGRISQLREWLKTSWETFHGEKTIRNRLRPVAAYPKCNKPATVSAVAGVADCRAGVHANNYGSRGPVQATVADLQSDHKPRKTRRKQGSEGSTSVYFQFDSDLQRIIDA